MKEFLEDFSKIIELRQQVGLIENSAVREKEDNIAKHMKKQYDRFNENEKKQIVEILYDLAERDEKLFVYMLSLVASCVKDKNVLQEICNKVLYCDFDIIYSMNLLGQISSFLFRNGIEDNSLFEVKKKIYIKNIRKLREQLGKREYIPYKRRKKRVVLVIAPLIAGSHAPSLKLDNMAYFLENLGYEVLVVSVNSFFIQLRHDCDWYRSVEENKIFNKTTEFEIDYNLTRLKGYYILFSDNNYFEMTDDILDKIHEYCPEFVMMIGDRCPVADLCSDFTTVITMACTKNTPVTTAPILARYFNYSHEEEEIYRSHIDAEQVVIDLKYSDIVQDSHKKYTKEQFGNEEKDFLVCIAGKRLDSEVSEEMIYVLEQILKENEEVKIVFIGDCPKLESVLKDSIYKERFCFWGFQKEFKAAIGVCDLFLNPPRQGGGWGAAHACAEQVPVITLPHCDCSQAGEAFICNSIDEMPGLVHKYIHDKDFMDRQKAVCRMKIQEREGRDNLKEIQNMCDFVKEYTLKKEERLPEVSIPKN